MSWLVLLSLAATTWGTYPAYKLEIGPIWPSYNLNQVAMIIKLPGELGKAAVDMAGRLAAGSKPSKILKQQIVLLEVIDHEQEKLKTIGYCDYEMAYFCFQTIEALMAGHPKLGSDLVDGIRSVLEKQQLFLVKVRAFLDESSSSPLETTVDEEKEANKEVYEEVDALFQRFQRLNAGKDLPNDSMNGNGVLSPTTGGHKSATIKPKPESKCSLLDVIQLSESISAEQLLELMGCNNFQILLVDYRTKREYDYNHIKYQDVVNIDPSWVQGLQADASDFDLDRRLQMLMPDDQYAKFRKRALYDLIVVYNLKYGAVLDRFVALEALLAESEKSKSMGIPTASPFLPLVNLIVYKTKYLSTKLKRYPMFLCGGVSHWYEVHGEKSIEKTIDPTPQLVRPLATLPKGSFSLPPKMLVEKERTNLPSTYLKSFNDYINTASTSSQMPVPNPTSSSILPLALQFQSSPSSKFPESQMTSAPSIPAKVPINGKDSNSLVKATNPKTKDITKQDSQNKNLPTFLLSISCGLTNLGNSCYMNCILQCLAATPQLTGFFFLKDSISYRQHINVNNILGTKGIITTNFVQLLTSMFANDGKSFTPLHFKKVVGSLSPNKEFALFDQQDCIEFLNFVLDSLHEDLNQMAIYTPQEKQRINELTDQQERARELLPIRLALTIEWERYLKLNFSIVVDYFQGQYLSRLECLECGQTLTTYNSFLILSLPLSNKRTNISLDDCLKEFVKKEQLDEANKWHCPNCKKFTNLTKKINITRLPQVLIIHFKRFRVLPTGYIDKINTMITYPVDNVLDLTSYWPTTGTNLSERSEMTIERELEMLASLPTRNQIPPFRYKLYGVVNHFGNLLTGHYTSYVFKQSDNKKKRGWCYFDDAKISYNCKESAVMNTNAYCLFYQRVRE